MERDRFDEETIKQYRLWLRTCGAKGRRAEGLDPTLTHRMMWLLWDYPTIGLGDK